jgi:hypothetical protein
VLIHSAPQIVLLAGDLENDLIEMPLVARAGQPPTDDVGELLLRVRSRYV